jgi:hypothetical protein
MNTEYFPHFVRLNYPSIGSEPNELLIELGSEFKKYLEETFKDNKDKLEPIWDIEPKKIIMNQINKSPFTINGYHPALIIHFEKFVEKVKKEYKE